MNVGEAMTTLARRFVATAALVSALGLGAELAHARGASGSWVEIFSLSYEANVPTWYSSTLLFACGVALAHASVVLRRERASAVLHRSFALLAVGFTTMSLDEAIEIHEYTGALFHGTGALHFGWVVPAFAVVTLAVVALVPFLRALDPITRRRFVVAGAIYVGGAVVCELPLGIATERWGTDSLAYGLVDWVEESLEMLGAGLFLLAILAYPGESRDEASP